MGYYSQFYRAICDKINVLILSCVHMRFILIILSMLLVSLCRAQGTVMKKYDLLKPPFGDDAYMGYPRCDGCGRSDMKGKVRRITTFDTVYIDANEIYIHYYISDYKQGRLISFLDSLNTITTENGTILGRSKKESYVYTNGILQKIITTDADGVRYITFSYDRHGRLINKVSKKKRRDGLFVPDRITWWKYIDGGNTIEEYTTRYGRGFDTTCSRKSYNAVSNEIKEYLKGIRGHENEFLLASKTTFSSGNIAYIEYYDDNGEISFTKTYTYDGSGRLNKEVITNSKTTKTIEHFYSEWDGHSNYRKETSVTDGDRDYADVYTRQIEYYP